MAWLAMHYPNAWGQVFFKTEHFTTEDGLSYRWAMEAVQDSLGFIWIATFDGLNRFDGHRFQVYRPQEQVAPELEYNDHRLVHLACAGPGDIWLGTETGKMLLFRPGAGRFEPLRVGGDTLSNLTIRSLHTTRGNNAWAILHEKGSSRHWLMRPARGTNRPELVMPLELGGPYQFLGQDGRGNLWIWEEQAFLCLDIEKGVPRRYAFSTSTGSAAGHSSLPIDDKGRFWYPDAEGVFQSFSLPPSIPRQQWSEWKVDNAGNLWPATRDKRMYRFSVKDQALEFAGNFNFWDHYLGDPYIDREGNIWFPHFYGLTKLGRRRQLFENYLHQPLQESGATQGGHSLYRLWEEDDGSILIEGLNKTFFRLDPHTRDVQPLREEIPDVVGNVHSRLLAAMQLLDIEPYYDIPSFPYYFSDEEQALWISHPFDSAVFRIPYGEERYSSFTVSKAPLRILCILPQAVQVWVGTDKGLYSLDLKTGRSRHYSTAQGLPNQIVYSILPEGPNLWLGTHNGLCRFNPETGETRNYFIDDGLTHNEFNRNSILRTRDGKIYFGGLNGLNAFYPAELERAESSYRSHLQFTQFMKVDGHRDSLFAQDFSHTALPAIIRLSSTDRSFIFRFFLDSYFKSSKNRYLYYLEGWEEPWSNQTSEGQAVYLHLPAGKYTFRVKAADPLGNWAANEIAVSVVMPRVWYKRWWAWSVYVLALLAVSYGLYRFRLKQHLDRREALRLQELDEVKTRLYTNITHEFRTPLTIILGMTEQLATDSGQLADDSPLKTDFRQKLDVVTRNGENLLHLVNQMLDLARLESGKLSLHYVQADIINYLRYIAASFQSFAANKKIELHFLPETESFYMDFDRPRILNILSNLLSNAVKFTGEGGHIYVRTTGGGDRFLIEVKDTGIGIPEDKLPHIFDRFYQVDDTHTRKGEGTGIGLTLARELVKMMGGEISVKSRVGEGTEFTVTLPVSRQAPLASDEKGLSPLKGHALAESPEIAAEENESTALPLLLAVEDNADVAQYIRSSLEGKYRVIHAADGREGIEKAIEEVPDIIISDVMMPDKDGFELVQTLKQDGRTSHIPIVLLTAKADIASKLEGLERGADAYLPKPFHQKELQLNLRNLLEQQKRLQEKYAGQDFSAAPATKNADPENAFLQKATHFILERLDDAAFGNEGLARQMLMSESQLNRKIKALTGKTLSIFIRSVRLQEACKMIKSTGFTISEIAYAVGFTDPAYFSRTFSQEFGKAPSAFRG